MAVGTINSAKEQTPVGYQPLLLATITFGDSATNPTILRLSSHPLNVADGGSQYGGFDWLPRLVNQDITTAQAVSEEGIDVTPAVTLYIADPDNFIKSNYADGIGFKGAQLQLTFIFWNVDNGIVSGDFSSDSLTKFLGVCGSPESNDDGVIQLTATSLLSMSMKQLPPGRIQKTCLNNFPQAFFDRKDGAANPDSRFFECGYSPDCSGGVGNFQATAALSASCLGTDPTISVGTVTGTLPSLPFTATLNIDALGQNLEIVIVTGITGGTWTVTRGAQGTNFAAFPSGTLVRVAYPTCDLTRASCMLRLGKSSSSRQPSGDLTHDNAGNHTGRFNGIDYQPDSSALVRPYISGKWEQIFNNTQQGKYGDLIPLNYGSTWVQPKVLWVAGDGNFTAFELLLGFGEPGFIYNVVVNGVRIPHTYNDTVFSQVPNELPGGNNIGGGYWIGVSSGFRNGNLNTAITTADSEPYGSLAVLYVKVPTQLADSQSVPSVSVMLDGPKVHVYSTPTTFTREFSDNPAWVILDLLRWAGWRFSQIDLQSFIDAAAICDASIPFHDQFGNSATQLNIPLMDVNGNVTSTTRPYSRYSTSFSLGTRRSAADVVRGIRNSMKGLILPNYENAGLLQLAVKSTLAGQQGAPVAGSNFNTAISSLNPDGSTGSGYAAYYFDESNIIRKNGKSTLKISSRKATEQPNTITVQFQNIENMLNQDSQTTVDTEDMGRYGQEVDGNIQIDGANNFDQVRRIIATYQAETYRGNKRLNVFGGLGGDTGGTDIFTWETTAKAVHLKLGHIVMFSEQRRGITNQLVRITSVKPEPNFETCTISAQFHNDIWYLDSYGQINAPIYQNTPHADGLRPPYAWSPGVEAPPTGDSMFAPTEKIFQFSQQYGTAADGSGIATLNIAGKFPVNTPSPTAPPPPFLNFQGATASTGGTLAGGLTYYVAICAKDQAGSTYGLSMPSQIARVAVPAGTNTNTITVGVPNWATGTPGYVIFAGTTANKLTYQGDANTTPATITLAAYNAASWGMPDKDFDHIRVYGTLILHSGDFGAQIAAVTSTTIKIALLTNDGFGIDQWAGYDISLLAQCSDSDTTKASNAAVPIYNARVDSNTVDILTLAFGAPDPTASGIKVGDVVVMRMLPVFGSDSIGNYFEDANLVNALNPLQEPYNVTNLAVVAGPLVKVTLATAAPWSTGDKVYFQNTGTAVDGIQTVTVIDPTHATINGLTSLGGTWSGAGIANRQSQGLVPSEEKGSIALAISGTGRGMWLPIQDNTATRLYVQGTWPTPPDSTTRIIVGAPTWSIKQDLQSVNTTSPSTVSVASVDVTNYKGEAVIVQAVAVDGAGDEALVWNSPLREIYLFGQTAIGGFKGAIYLTVNGTLAIGSNLAPLVQINDAITPLAVRLITKQAPSGAGLTVNINTGSTLFMTLTIPNGSTVVDAASAQLSAAPMLVAQTNATLDITGVGTTFPGSDLTAIIYY